MSSILEEIETKIEGLKTSTTKSNVGIVRETSDGVARIEGLSDCMLNITRAHNGVANLDQCLQGLHRVAHESQVVTNELNRRVDLMRDTRGELAHSFELL